MHTSRLVGGPSGWEAIPREDFRERDLGVLEALTTEEMLESEPETYGLSATTVPNTFLRAGRASSSFATVARGRWRELPLLTREQKLES